MSKLMRRLLVTLLLAFAAPAFAQVPPLNELAKLTPHTCDGFSASDGAITAGSRTFTSATAGFTEAAVGKTLSVYGAGAGGVSLVTRIAGRSNTTTVTLDTAATGTVSGALFGYGSDYSAQINAAILSGVQLPKGACGIASTINLPTRGILLGQGTAGYGLPQTTLLWLGAVGGIAIAADTGSGSVGVRAGDFTIDGLCAAAKALNLREVRDSWFYPIYTQNVTAAGFTLDTAASVLQGAQNNDFMKINADASHICADSADAAVIGQGTATTNINNNRFWKMEVTNRNGRGLVVGNADSNYFFNFKESAAGGGTGNGLEFLASSASIIQMARSNIFYTAKSSNAIVSNTDTFPATNNWIDHLVVESVYPAITVNGTSVLRCRDSQGGYCGSDGWQTYTPTLTCVSGTLTSAVGSGRYRLDGKTVFLEQKIVITTNGTCALALRATLPTGVLPTIDPGYVLAGVTTTGTSVPGGVSGSGYVNMKTYNNGYPGADGVTITVSGIFERQ